ncbi:aminoacyl-tRNA hydrolase [Eubacteriales bacterium OttesenSCG-928-M02]|nr:aminoacyl-tRNA hydrolase [Eubacteriales bacterium OttesenSCG-928-M02]
MKLVFGLGNPGTQYSRTLHNAGFLALDAMAKRLGLERFKKKRGAMVTEWRSFSQRALLIKPQTFMNLSGNCVLAFASYYKVAPEDIIVVYDDIDLAAGAVRIRDHGSGGTHNGMRHIIQAIGTQDFMRVRIGIDAPPPGWDLVDYVLSTPQGMAWQEIEAGIEKGAEAAICLIEKGLEEAQQRYNNKGHNSPKA